MLKNIPIQKVHVLAALAVMLWLLAVRFGFYRIWQAARINRELTAQLSRASDVSYQPDYLERKNKNLGRIISQYQVDTVSYRSTVLEALSALAEQEKVRITELPAEGSDPYFQTPHFSVQRLGFEGNFFALTRFLHKIQAVNHIGQVRSVVYKVVSQQGKSVNERKLSLQVYLETAR